MPVKLIQFKFQTVYFFIYFNVNLSTGAMARRCWSSRATTSAESAAGQHAAQVERTSYRVARSRRPRRRHRTVRLRHWRSLGAALRARRQERLHVLRRRADQRRLPLSTQTGAFIQWLLSPLNVESKSGATSPPPVLG